MQEHASFCEGSPPLCFLLASLRLFLNELIQNHRLGFLIANDEMTQQLILLRRH